MGERCPECAKIEANNRKRALAKDKFIKDSKALYGDKFEYSKVDYIDQKTPVEIICPIHGSFMIKPDNFLRNNAKNRYGCQKCAKNHRYTLEEWKETANKIHHGEYSYDKITEYTNAHQMMTITCSKHGDFIQEANSHLQGCRCPKCSMRKSQLDLYNKLVSDLAIDLEFDYRPTWIGKQIIDIYSIKYNFAIEYNGKQHYEPVEFFGGEETFLYNQEQDAKREQKCKENNCPLFWVKYDYTEEDYQNLLDSIKTIINNAEEENRNTNRGTKTEEEA